MSKPDGILALEKSSYEAPYVGGIVNAFMGKTIPKRIGNEQKRAAELRLHDRERHAGALSSHECNQPPVNTENGTRSAGT